MSHYEYTMYNAVVVFAKIEKRSLFKSADKRLIPLVNGKNEEPAPRLSLIPNGGA